MLNCAVRPSSSSSVSRATLVGEDLLADLAAAGELGPVAGVGGRGDDLGVDGGRRHAGEQDRRLAGEAGEGGVDDGLAVAAVDQPGGVDRPVGGARDLGAGGEEGVAALLGGRGDHGDAAAAQGATGHVGRQVDGPRSTTQRVSGPDGVGQLARPVDGVDADGVGEVLGQTGVQAAGLGPVADQVDGRREGRVVEAEGDRERLDDRVEGATAAGLGLELGGVGVRALLDRGPEAAQGGGRAAHDDAARAVDRGDGGSVLAGGGRDERGPRAPRGWRR